MKILLTNSVIRAFKKRDGNISFHLRTYFLVYSKVSFSISTYLRDISSWLILPDGTKIEFDIISHPVYSESPYDGKILVSELHLTAVSAIKKVSNCLVDLSIRFHFSFTGHPAEEAEEHKYKAIVRKCYR